MKLSKILYYVSLILIAVGLSCFIAAIVTKGKLSDVLYIVSSVTGVVAIVLLFVRLSFDANAFNGESSPKVVVKVVDVKEIKKTKEQQLYEQYEELYKQNLITKKDLDNKKKELLR